MWDSMGQFIQNLQMENQRLRAENERLQGLIRELSSQLDQAATGEAQRIRALVVQLAEKHAAAGLADLRQSHGAELDTWSTDRWLSWLDGVLEQVRLSPKPKAVQEVEQLQREANLWYGFCVELKRDLEECQRQLAEAHDEIETLEQELDRLTPVTTDAWEEDKGTARLGSVLQKVFSEPAPPSLPFTEAAKQIAPQRDLRFQLALVNVIQGLAYGEDCRREPLMEWIGTHSAGYATQVFNFLLEQGYVDRVAARLGPGRPTELLFLTEKGWTVARQTGVEPEGGVPALLAAHRKPEQVLLVVKARVLLAHWYNVDLYPKGFRTPAGRQCRPDIVLLGYEDPTDKYSDEVTLYVEAEVHPVVSPNYAQNRRRIRKWEIFREVNNGRLYIVLPDETREQRMVREIERWQAVTGLKVVLYTTNVRTPPAGSPWHLWRW